MIDIIPEGSALDFASLVGRIVLKDANLHWAAFGSPVRVMAVRGKILDGRKVRLIYASDARGPGLPGMARDTREGRDDGDDVHVVARTVRCVCDTEEEVIALLHAREDAGDAFVAFKREAKSRLAAMNGMEIAAGAVVEPARVP